MTLRGFPFYGAGPRAPKEEGGCKGGDALGGDIRYTGEPSVEGGHFLLRGGGVCAAAEAVFGFETDTRPRICRMLDDESNRGTKFLFIINVTYLHTTCPCGKSGHPTSKAVETTPPRTSRHDTPHTYVPAATLCKQPRHP